MRTRPIVLPQGTVTGIGSLPLTDPQAALAFVAQLWPEGDFWPQLPWRSVNEQMIEQVLGSRREFFVQRAGGYGYQVKTGQLRACLEDFSTGTATLNEHCASGFFAFERACASHVFTHAQALKGQLVGPITLACSLFAEERAFLFEKSHLDAVSHLVERLALWQMHRLQQWKLPVICFLDEPCLALLTREPFQQEAGRAIQALRKVVATMQAAGILVGLHCCADQVSFQMMCQVAPDMLSFDASRNLEVFASSQDARLFLKQGGLVACGLIPTVSNLTRFDAPTFFTRWLLASQDKGDISQVAAQTIITATCGLGLLPLTQAEANFHLAQRVALLVKKVARDVN